MSTKKITKKTAKSPAKKAVRKVSKKITKSPAKKTARKAVVKKVNKKSTTKKSPVAKKVSTKKVSVRKRARSTRKPLIYSEDPKSFWTTNGQVLNSLIALRDALDAMEKEVYMYHARETHNDFADWVSDVLCDGKCAVALQKAKTPRSARTVVVKHLKSYSV